MYLLCFIPLSTKILKQILQTDLRTFPKRISWENLTKNQGLSPLMITSLIHVPFFLDDARENKIDVGPHWDLNANSNKP